MINNIDDNNIDDNNIDNNNIDNNKNPNLDILNIHIIKLYGKNPQSVNSYAKVSINKKFYVEQYKWYLGKDGYPFAYIEGSRVPLHRYIHYLNTNVWSNNYIGPDNKKIILYVDHVNRDKLDSTDENLRLATPAENSYNKTSKSTIIDPYTLQPLHHIKFKKSGYEICINKDGNIHKINKINSLEEAKEIYNMMALELFGEYAVLY